MIGTAIDLLPSTRHMFSAKGQIQIKKDTYQKAGMNQEAPKKSNSISCPSLSMGFRTVHVFGFSLHSQTTGVSPGVKRAERCLLSLKLKTGFPKSMGEGPKQDGPGISYFFFSGDFITFFCRFYQCSIESSQVFADPKLQFRTEKRSYANNDPIFF
jgi:hypothetical protein